MHAEPSFRGVAPCTGFIGAMAGNFSVGGLASLLHARCGLL
ncbi:hypothetical protein DA2_1531 [Desulfovibrio sp. A2]|nr:hypothetical protein DA2_1531 [Desulfovibrio sp. A2]